ncbi:hypothetical protein BCD49_06490 [Pseudofrankia sp. EUN1h]|nr:hypothetical protein BCD49_06490 [Pseudofrankia sp. EUN1h]
MAPAGRGAASPGARRRAWAAVAAVVSTTAMSLALTAAPVHAGPPAPTVYDPTGLAWGDNYEGKLGDGTEEDRSSPVQSVGLPALTAVSAGQGFGVGLDVDGTVWTWGINSWGQLGTGSAEYSRAKPAQVPGLTGVVQIATGRAHVVALRGDGTVWTWGYNGVGALGDGHAGTNRSWPEPVPHLDGVRQVAAGANHSLVLKDDGTVWGFGKSGDGQLGAGTTSEPWFDSPVEIHGVGPDVVQISGSELSSALVRGDGTVWAWGNNECGLVRPGTDQNQVYADPVRIPRVENVIKITTGDANTLVISSHDGKQGQVIGWGCNQHNELGLHHDGSIPRPVEGLPATMTEVSNRNYHTAARSSDGTVWTSGSNSDGQLGHGPVGGYPVGPAQVPGLTGAVHVSAGMDFTLAVAPPILEKIDPDKGGKG